MDIFNVDMKIERVQMLLGHTEYIIKVKIGVGEVVLHTNEVVTRYSDLEESFDAKLRANGIELNFPPKKFFGSMSRTFIEERQSGLQKYLNIACSNLLIATSLPFRSFFFPPTIKGKYDEESALTHLSILFRSNPGWAVVRPLAKIGWRPFRYAFEVKPTDATAGNSQFLATWSEHGSLTTSDNGFATVAQAVNDLKLAFRYIQSIRHPNVAPLLNFIVDELGVLCVRQLSVPGSLRDLVRHVRPPGPIRDTFLRKYWHVAQSAHLPVLPIQQIRSIGKQVLEALSFLLEKGITFGHLHAGNVLVTNAVDCTCQLTDIEDGVLRMVPLHTWNARKLHRIITLNSMSVFAFGHTLFECVFGRMLADDSTPTSLAHNEVPRMLTELLEQLITRSGARQGLPSLSDLLANPIFQNASQPDPNLSKRNRSLVTQKSNPDDAETNVIGAAKMTDAVKRIFEAAQNRLEENLKEEQRLMAIQRRKSKAESRQSLTTLMKDSSDDAPKSAAPND